MALYYYVCITIIVLSQGWCPRINRCHSLSPKWPVKPKMKFPDTESDNKLICFVGNLSEIETKEHQT